MSGLVNIGLVGAGFAANIHARGYLRSCNDCARLFAVAAVPSEQAVDLAARYGIDNVYESYEALLACSDVDVVDLCVPNNLHAPFAVAAAEAGKHIICEKPLTGYFGGQGAAEPVGNTPKSLMLTEALKTAQGMVQAARDCRVKLMYAENWLYAPPVQKALRLVQASRGSVLEIRAQECHSGSHAPYAKEWRYAGGGSLMRLGAHPLGTALYVKRQEGLLRDGQPIRLKSVSAEVGDITHAAASRAKAEDWIVSDWHDVENWAAVVLTFEDGTHALISATDTALGGMVDTLDIHLSNARISCDMGHSSLIRAFAPDPTIFGDEYLAEKLETKAGWSFPSVDEEWLLGYPQELRDFVEAVRFDRAPLSDDLLGLDVVRAIYAAYQSAEEGRRVDL